VRRIERDVPAAVFCSPADLSAVRSLSG
jgi:hypothetical protein